MWQTAPLERDLWLFPTGKSWILKDNDGTSIANDFLFQMCSFSQFHIGSLGQHIRGIFSSSQILSFLSAVNAAVPPISTFLQPIRLAPSKLLAWIWEDPFWHWRLTLGEGKKNIPLPRDDLWDCPTSSVRFDGMAASVWGKGLIGLSCKNSVSSQLWLKNPRPLCVGWGRKNLKCFQGDLSLCCFGIHLGHHCQLSEYSIHCDLRKFF